MTTESQFLSEHGAHLRQTLIMIEAEDGAFRLIAHGDVTAADGRARHVAVVHSTSTDREYLLVHDGAAGRGCTFSWHCATRAEQKELMHDVGARPGDDLAATIVKQIKASEHAES